MTTENRTISQGSAAQDPAFTPIDQTAPPAPGAPGDFDFLTGDWRIRNRRLAPGADAWDEFDGEASWWSILGGVGRVEELRIPARDFAGMGLRLLDRERQVWVDHWVNARAGVLTPPGSVGGFRDGVGVFASDYADGDAVILVRGVWDQIGPERCRWRQLTSKDGGATWQENWIMHWTRAEQR